MTATDIALAYCTSGPQNETRLNKAKACAKRFRVEWREVETLIAAYVPPVVTMEPEAEPSWRADFDGGALGPRLGYA